MAGNEAKDADRLDQVLEMAKTEILPVMPALFGDRIVHGARNADTSGRGNGLKPCRHVHCGAKEIFAVDDNLTQGDADPKGEERVLALSAVQCLLHGERAADRLGRPKELGQDAVSGCVEDPPAMLLDERIDEAAAVAKRTQRQRFVRCHGVAVADRVRCQNGKCPPLRRLMHELRVHFG